MKRAILRNLTFYTRNHLNVKNQFLQSFQLKKPNPDTTCFISSPLLTKFRFFSSQNGDDDSSHQTPNLSYIPEETSSDESEKKRLAALADVEDVSNDELVARLNKYFGGDEEALPSILEALARRKLTGKHEETDDELMEDMRNRPLPDASEGEIQSDFEKLHETDEEIDDLYNPMEIIKRRMENDPRYNMDEKKWDKMVNEGIQRGIIKDTRECEENLENMLNWDKLLPDEIKQKVEKKFNEIVAMMTAGEIDDEKGYELFKEFEDKIVLECAELMEAQAPPQFDDAQTDKKKDVDDPPGEGPILRWQSRVVFLPGNDSWHPKNRKIKMGVTVKELELNKHEFRRLRELVGKRYHPGKDELMITSERFEHREENRKDCLRTLYALIEEAEKANKLVSDARTSYVKERLRANPEFMERLRAKKLQSRGSLPS